jgi:hypothetical protein
MEVPPPVLNNARVLEYAIFDATVRRTEVWMIDAFPWKPKPIAALAICQGRVPGEKNEVYLFYCGAEWSIERVQAWNTPRGPKLESTEVIRVHAETLYAGSAARWVKVDELLLPSPR